MHIPAFSIYDASAGSGKTYTLVKEYLKIILLSKKPDAYKNILAITFTNKAVHEMKGRVVNSLFEFSKDNPSEKTQQLMQHIEQETNISVKTIQEKSKQIIKYLIHNYAAFDILTIDKFTHKVIRTFAHDLNLSVNFEVSVDSNKLLTEAVELIIDEAGTDPVLTNLLITFATEKADDDKSWDISRDIFEIGKLILNENNREEISHFNEKKIEDFIAIKSKLIAFCKEIETETITLAMQALSLIEKNGIDDSSFPYQTFPKHLNFIVNKDVRAHNHKFIVFDDIKIKVKSKDEQAIITIIPQLLSILEIIYVKFEKKHLYEAFLKNITQLSLLSTLSKKLQEIQKSQNILSIAEFNKIIFEQIQQQPAPFIYERMGERYRHFFIDEFQDTSQMQWHNLIPLINNATSSQDLDGTRGSLMIVGDPKQSIYRWRGGKAEQFIELSNNKNPFNNPDVKLFSLDTNYRSFSEIINFNNTFFKLLSDEFINPDYKNLYANHSHQKTNSQIGGYVNISFVKKHKKNIEFIDDEENTDTVDQYLNAVLDTILKIENSGFSYSDIAILTRKKNHGTTIANFLTQKGIPIVSSENLLLSNCSEVKVLIDILNYIKNEDNLEAKASFLYYFAVNLQSKMPIHDFISEGIQYKEETNFENWLSLFDIRFSFQKLRKKSLYETVEYLIMAIIKPEKQTAYVQFFQDLVLEQDIKRQSGISDFLNYWSLQVDKISIPLPEENNAVKIMTIHKSKGLQFPVVIFPFADEDYSKSPQEKIWLDVNENSLDLNKILVDKSSKVENYGTTASKIYNEKKQEDLLDDINILYVALTRAEEQLHIISSMKIDENENLPNNMSSFFVKYLKTINLFNNEKFNYEFGEFKKLSPNKINFSKTQIIKPIKIKLNPKKIKIAKKESVMWNTTQQKAIEYGNVLHEILSYIETKNDLNLAFLKALENGLITISEKKEFEKIILKIMNHPELEDYFSDKVKILNEKSIIQENGKILKPDRIVINNKNEIYLLDYKTGIPKKEHENQLKNYEIAIKQMGFQVNKKILLYIDQDIQILNV